MKVKKYLRMNWCLGVFLFWMFYSCNTNREQELLKEITLFQSRPINYYQNKLISDSMFQGKLKYIVYSDSINCTSCAINQMDLWNPLIKYSKNYEGQLNFYFIFCPAKKDIQRVKLALCKNTALNNLILLDTLGEFEKWNPHLPKNKMLHTFLLDENNNVILVGSPLHNKNIRKMFYQVVEEKLGKAQQSPVKEE